MDFQITKSKSDVLKENQEGNMDQEAPKPVKLKEIPGSLLPKLNQLITSKRSFYEALQ